jgi:hypothetical protein
MKWDTELPSCTTEKKPVQISRRTLLLNFIPNSTLFKVAKLTIALCNDIKQSNSQFCFAEVTYARTHARTHTHTHTHLTYSSKSVLLSYTYQTLQPLSACQARDNVRSLNPSLPMIYYKGLQSPARTVFQSTNQFALRQKIYSFKIFRIISRWLICLLNPNALQVVQLE